MMGSAEALKYNYRDLAIVKEVLKLVLGRTCCVQAGGHLGVYPAFLAQHFACVLTFEPDPDLFLKLVANAPERNIVKVQAALGCAPGLVGTRCERRDGSTKPVHEGLTHVVPRGLVPTLRLDDFHLPTVDALLLDVEGYELFALQGASDTIARCRPVIALEINYGIECYGFKAEDVRRCVEGFGYQRAFTQRSDEVYVPC